MLAAMPRHEAEPPRELAKRDSTQQVATKATPRFARTDALHCQALDTLCVRSVHRAQCVLHCLFMPFDLPRAPCVARATALYPAAATFPQPTHQPTNN